MNEHTLIDLANRALADRPFPEIMFPPSPYYRFLMHLAAEMHPSLSVELGVCGGGGSLHLCRGYSGGHVVGIDTVNDYPQNIQYIKQNFMNYHFWIGDSILAAKKIHRLYGDVDILFIDTIHTKEQTILEFESWQPYLSTRAVVCFDDLLRNEMAGFWEWLPGNKLRIDELHPTAESGFGVWWK